MLGYFTTRGVQRYVSRGTAIKRFNSNIGNNASNIANKESQEEGESTGSPENKYMTLPWETGFDKTSPNPSGGNDMEEFPWSTATPSVENEHGETQRDIIDPSKSELILAPPRRKSSPIQKLKSKKKVAFQKNRSEEISFQMERDYKNLMKFQSNISNTDFINIIDELKPAGDLITIKQFNELSNTLERSFKVKQLKQYINTSCPEIALKKSDTKKRLISKIISEHWKLEITLDPTGDLVSETRIDLSNKRDLFLLLSNKGFLPKHWSLIGAQLSLGKSRKELVVRGTKNITNFVQASWNELLNNVSSDTLELKDIMKFYKQLNKELNLNSLEQETGVYFDKVSFDSDKDSYVISSVKNASLSYAKVQILKATEYRYGCNTLVLKELVADALKLDEQNEHKTLIKLEISDDTLPWYIKQEDYFRYSKIKTRLTESLLSDESMIVKLLSDEVQELKIEVDEAREKFEYNYVQTKEEAQDKRGQFEQSDNQFFKIEEETKVDSGSIEDITKQICMTSLVKELEIEELERDPSKLVLDNTITVKYGKLLFNKKDESDRFFSENLPEVIRNVGKLELMDKSSRLFGVTGGIMNRFNKQLHIKLIPNGFWNNEMDNFIKFPSLDLLIDLKDDRLEVNNFVSLVSEQEKNVEVCLPSYDVDLKFQNSLNSMLVYNKDQWLLNGGLEQEFRECKDNGEENDIVLNKRQINMLISQVGKRKFDIKSREGLHGLITQFRCKPYLFHFNGKPVKYSAIAVEYVKSIELEYDGFPVSLELRQDGDHDRVELSMLKEDDSVDMETFVRTSVSLAAILSA